MGEQFHWHSAATGSESPGLRARPKTTGKLLTRRNESATEIDE
ncbi:MAG: hypothetical protein [Olavius algarvensis Gamma 3 endosymbiont]|nr:MAG: hypothetical protein [Olavius algarvensis Gamma 3 endosymbiont]